MRKTIGSLLMSKTKGNRAVTKPEKNSEGPIKLDKSGNITLQILAKPGAKKSGITSIDEEEIGVQIAARPVDGEANSELIQFIASVLKLKRSAISLDRGSKSRQKIVVISSKELTKEEILNLLKQDMG